MKEQGYLDKLFIEKYIPSPEVRELVIASERAFSEWEKASLIWNSSLLYEDKLKELKAFNSVVTDEKLKCQIDERLSYEQEAIRLFKEKREGFIYTVLSDELLQDSFAGYFGTYDMAWKEGIDIGYEMSNYSITKNKIIYSDKDYIHGRMIFPKDDELGRHRDEVVQMNLVRWSAGEMKLNEKGEIISFESNEMPIDSFSKFNKSSAERFEYGFVQLPNPFEKGEALTVIGMPHSMQNGDSAVMVTSQDEWTDLEGKATRENSDYIFSDEYVCVYREIPGSPKLEQSWIPLMNLTRSSDKHCNSFMDDHAVILGHDLGAAVWIQAADIDDAEMITSEQVHETGLEISIAESFFDKNLRQCFVDHFNEDLTVNKKRFTRAFEDEGRFIKGFESRSLEPNFYTFEETRALLDYIDGFIDNYDNRFRYDLTAGKATNIAKIAELIRLIMKLSPDAGYLSVMS
ncbi:MAG: hypothetical protein E7301_13915 [Butyrivibrio sp.]|nr:hypothetical protein [Butyrivibrio sp.]